MSDKGGIGKSAVAQKLPSSIHNPSVKVESEKRYEYEGVGVRYNSNRTLSPVGQILAKILRRSGLDQKLAKYQFIEFWPQIVGKVIAEKAKPEAIRNRVLIVRVESSAWAQELSFQKKIIQSRLNNFLGAEQSVDDIHFYVSGQDQLANRRAKPKS